MENLRDTLVVLKKELLPALESVFWKGDMNHPEKRIMVDALKDTISFIELQALTTNRKRIKANRSL